MCCGRSGRAGRRPLRAAGRRGRSAGPSGRRRSCARRWRCGAGRRWRISPTSRSPRSEIARLEELRLGALEQRIDADLATGRHADLVGELEALIGEHPLRERLRGQLMLALYRCRPPGRGARGLPGGAQRARRGAGHRARPRGCASSTRRSSRRIPATSIRRAGCPAAGGRPGPARAARSSAASESSPSWSPASTTSSRRPRPARPGRGRARHRQEPPRRGADRARARRAARRCWSAAAGRPAARRAYWPWAQSLRAVRARDRPERLRVQLGARRRRRSRSCCPSCEPLDGSAPSRPRSSPRGRAFGCSMRSPRSWHARAARADSVLVLDDLHAADEPSLLLLRFLARELGDEPRCWSSAPTATSSRRSREPLADDARRARSRAGRDALALGGLPRATSSACIELAAADRAPPDSVAAIHARDRGQPAVRRRDRAAARARSDVWADGHGAAGDPARACEP